MGLGQYKENLNLARLDFLHTTKRVIFGCEAISSLGVEAKRLGAKRLVFVADRSLRKIGLTDKAEELLKEQDFEITFFDEISSEPTIESLQRAVSFMRDGKFDLVIGFGGGSAMDTAKACAIMATNPGDIKEYIATPETAWEDKVKNRGAPLILIPTTSGTGSENTGSIMIIDGDYKTWIGSVNCFPDVAIVDPTLTLTLPPNITAATGMDALAHALEGYMINALANPWVNAFALEAIKLVAQNLRLAYHDGKNLQARWNMSWAAHLGGWVANATFGPATLGHCLAEAIGSKYHIPHGIICGICLPYVMKFNLPAITDRLATVASTMGENVHGLKLRDAALTAVNAVLELIKDVDLPLNLKAFNVPRSDASELAEYIVKERQYMYYLPNFNPRKLTVQNVTELLEDMIEGRI